MTLGPAKPRPEEKPKLVPTGTPGVFKNTKTGMLETDLPLPPAQPVVIPPPFGFLYPLGRKK